MKPQQRVSEVVREVARANVVAALSNSKLDWPLPPPPLMDPDFPAIHPDDVDKLIEKMISRKFLVWVTATILMITAGLESGDWVIISALYIGGQAVIDGIATLKGLNG